MLFAVCVSFVRCFIPLPLRCSSLFYSLFCSFVSLIISLRLVSSVSLKVRGCCCSIPVALLFFHPFSALNLPSWLVESSSTSFCHDVSLDGLVGLILLSQLEFRVRLCGLLVFSRVSITSSAISFSSAFVCALVLCFAHVAITLNLIFVLVFYSSVLLVWLFVYVLEVFCSLFAP